MELARFCDEKLYVANDRYYYRSQLQDGVSLLGGVIGAMHIPEKWFPGCLDYYLNSHNIMHILVVTAVYSMHQVSPHVHGWLAICWPLTSSHYIVRSQLVRTKWDYVTQFSISISTLPTDLFNWIQFAQQLANLYRKISVQLNPDIDSHKSNALKLALVVRWKSWIEVRRKQFLRT